MFVLFYLNHLPSKENVDSSLVTFFKCNLICVRELVNLFVWSPELNPGTFSSSTLKDILSEEMLVIEGVEISTFTLVRELW